MRPPLFQEAHMIQLHIWGANKQVSIIDPEGLASAWLLSIHLTPQKIDYRIVTSCNTNLADSGRLPLLLVTEDGLKRKYEGFYEISNYISLKYTTENTKYVPDDKLSAKDQLANFSLISYLNNTFKFVNQYNLYVNTNNYENYTRKLFKIYLPFPMMYNQPLKFLNAASEQVKIIGLGVNKGSFFSFHGGDEEIADTETFNAENEDEQDEIAISSLHEKVILAKLKDKALLKESKNSLRCLHALGEFVSHIERLFAELNANSPVPFAHLFRAKKISSSELLLYAYLHSLTYAQLPDRFIAEYLEKKSPAFWKFAHTIIEALNSSLCLEKFRDAEGYEIPSLKNEIMHLTSLVRY